MPNAPRNRTIACPYAEAMLLGTETEYGIWAPDAPGADPEWLSALVVDSFDGPATPVLAEAHNRVLGNGARLYVDHGHPELSTPETTNPTDATAHDLAGDRIVARAAARASERAGIGIRLFKNNTDGKGSSYGYHENYLLPRAIPWDRIQDVLATFLPTRVVFAGAGRVGIGTGESGRLEPGFQLAQRADFFERVSGLDTMRRRGIVNTRDEPHASPSRWRRLHVIAGDATRNPYSTWLKLGATALALEALQAGDLPRQRLADPVAAFRTVSRDLSLSAALPLVGGGTETALGLQRRFLGAAQRFAAVRDIAWADDVLAEWASTLDDLARDPAVAADRLDWPAKLALLEGLRGRDSLPWDAPRLAQLDLAWADLNDAASPFAALRRAGRLHPWRTDAQIQRATSEPPRDTRAWTRGHLVSDHGEAVVAATWDSVLVRMRGGALHNVRMSDPLAWTAADFDPSEPLDRLTDRE